MVSTTTRRPASAARSAERGRRGGLAHPAGPAADDDAGVPGRRAARRCRSGRRRCAGRAAAVDRAVLPGRAAISASPGRAARRRARERPPSSTPPASDGQLVIGVRRSCEATSRRAARARPLGVVVRPRRAGRPRSRRRRGSPAAVRPSAPAAPVDRARRPRPVELRSSSERLAHHVDDDAPRPAARRATARAMASRVSCTGISSSRVTTCTTVCGGRAAAA